jgi:hypothetical protein
MEEGSGPRFLNAGFVGPDSDAPVPTGEPLALDGGPYRLGVNVGEFWGPGITGDTPIDPLLEALFHEQQELELQVAVRSRSVGVAPAWKPLSVPRFGNSALVFFDLTFGRRGRHALDIDLFYRGHLLQSRHLEVEVVRHTGDAAPAGRPAQDGHPIFSRAATLSPEKLAVLDRRPSRLTITVQREAGVIGLNFYDWSRVEALGTQESRLTDASLNNLLDRTRQTLLKVMGAYGDEIGGDLEMFTTNLWQLADAGSLFYRNLLPTFFDVDTADPGEEIVDLALVPEQVIQVAPLSQHVGVPWELLYEQRIEPYRREREGRVRLCPEWQTHGLDPCPHADDPRVVCPSGFWGYRYVIEQLPNQVPPGEPVPQTDLPLSVRNDIPLRLAALVYEFRNLEDHLSGLQSLVPEAGRIAVERVETLDGVEELLTERDEQTDILYFYAHGGFEEDEPVLTLGPRNSAFGFTAGDLAAWPGIDLTARQPLVIVNACESAAYRPDRIENLLQGFVAKGASGIIGTQCRVPTGLADAFIRIFFRFFLGRTTVGEALYDARRALLENQVEGPDGPERRPDPRGLAYSLFAAADVKLGQPLLS